MLAHRVQDLHYLSNLCTLSRDVLRSIDCSAEKDWSGQLINDPTESLGFKYRQYYRKCRLGRPTNCILSLLVFKAARGKTLSKKDLTVDVSSFITKWIWNWDCICIHAENWLLPQLPTEGHTLLCPFGLKKVPGAALKVHLKWSRPSLNKKILLYKTELT